MKKFFSAFLTAILLVFPISLSACSNDGEWKEIQSIYYRTETGSTTVTSTYTWDIEYEDISREEYDAAPQEYKEGSTGSHGEMEIDRKKQLSELSQFKQKTFYYMAYTEHGQLIIRKMTYKNYEINYVKIRFMGDGSFELKNGDTTIRVLPTSYKVTYFSS